MKIIEKAILFAKQKHYNQKDDRGIILKFADRLSNLSRMNCWPEKRKEQYLRKSKFWKSEV